jgi:hypothetical protein
VNLLYRKSRAVNAHHIGIVLMINRQQWMRVLMHLVYQQQIEVYLKKRKRLIKVRNGKRKLVYDNETLHAFC